LGPIHEKGQKPISGTGSETVHNKVTLFWNQRKNRPTVPLGTSNVATFQLAPGYAKFRAICPEAEVDYDDEQNNPVTVASSQVVSDDEDDEDDIVESGSDIDATDWCHPIDAQFDFNDPNTTDQQTPNIVEDEEDQQPTSASAELLQYHHRFGHVSLQQIIEMAKQGIIPKRLAKCPVLACSACLYAKAIRRQWRHRTPNNKVESPKPTKPGERVPVDQNGIAERRIGELQGLARTMLIHANKRWPKVATANLWPYAVRMENDVLNETPSLRIASRQRPMQIFGDTKVSPNAKHWKPVGCPVYVLDTNLKAGKIHHKWKQRSRVGIYIGRSPQHARNVALVLNIETGLVNPNSTSSSTLVSTL
jgi:hypothetical protein